MSSRERAEDRRLPVVQRNASLLSCNTLGVAARAERLVRVRNVPELKLLYDRGVIGPETWVLGGGSNVLFAGRVEGVVLKVEIRFLEVVREGPSDVLIRVGAGNDWHGLVGRAVSEGWGGIENLALIPGTAGAAPIQNIGAYGVELKDCFDSLEAFDLERGVMRSFDPAECRFGYRDSVFKQELKGRFVITSLTLRLQKEPHRIHRSYRALDEWLTEKGIEEPGIRDVYDAVVEIRKSKLPDPKQLGNAGSFFKNPVVAASRVEPLAKKHGEIPSFPAGEGMVKVPAGWLIERAGWKGRRIGNVGVYENQALVIVNHGGADGKEILALADQIRLSVLETFGIELVPEVRIVGVPDE